jgi:hypothetical protein
VGTNVRVRLRFQNGDDDDDDDDDGGGGGDDDAAFLRAENLLCCSCKMKYNAISAFCRSCILLRLLLEPLK